MKRQFISVMMIGLLASSFSVGAFADTTPAETTTPAPTEVTAPVTPDPTATEVTTPVTPVVPVVTPVPTTEAVNGTVNQIEALKKQLEAVNAKISDAKNKAAQNAKNNKNAKDQKSKLAASAEQAKQEALLKQLAAEYNQKQNQLSAYTKQLQQVQGKLAQANESKYTDKEQAYLKSIEAALQKNEPKLVVIPADHIVSDNPAFKVDMPLAFKDGMVYMPKSVLEKQYGVAISYESQQKKFILKIEGTLVEMFLLQNIIEIDGVPRKAEARPIVIDEKIYIPVKGIAKLINVEFNYNKETNMLVIDDLDIQN